MIDYNALFGSTSSCACAHCRSVYGPAAYLVDVLHFLDDAQRAALFAPGRRPDLQHVELSCDNTDTVVPYLDLVNEVLEQAIAPSSYEKLAQAVHTWDLPFDLDMARARAFLDQLGVPRSELMRTFQRAAQPTDTAIAAESLGLTPFEWQIISGRDPRPDWEMWGMDGAWLDAGKLQNVGVCLRQAGLSYQDLVALLETRFVNRDPNHLLAIEFTDPDDPCNVDLAAFDRPLTAGDADRIHRFTRLRRALGWTARELDAAITLFGANPRTLPPRGGTEDTFGGEGGILRPVEPLNDALLVALAEVKEIRASYNLSVDQALALWTPPVTGDDPQRRETLLADLLGLSVADLLALRSLTALDPFNARRVADTRRFAALADKVRVSGLSPAQLVYLFRHAPTESPAGPAEGIVRATARALADGLRQIAQDTAPVSDPTGEVTRRKLGLLWKADVADQMTAMLIGSASYVSRTAPLVVAPAVAFPDELAARIAYDPVAQALRFIGVMTNAERTTLVALAGTDPALQDFKDAVDDLHAQPRAFLADTAAVFLTLPNDGVTLFDDDALTVEAKLQHFLVRLLPYLRTTLSDRLVKQALAGAVPLGLALVDLLLAGPIASCLTNALALSVPPSLTTDTQARWVGALTVPFNEPYSFYATANGPVVVRIDGKVAFDSSQNTTGPPLPLAAGPLHDLEIECDPANAGLEVDLRWSSPSTPKEIVPSARLIAQATLDAFAGSYLLLHKSALLINGLKLTAKEVAHLASHAADFDGFAWSAFPVEPISPDPGLLAQWERIYDLAAFRRRFAPRPVEPVDVFAATTLPDALALLAASTGWDETTLGDLATGFNLAAGDLKDERWPVRLLACFRLLAQLDVSTAQAFDWAAVQPTAAQAQAIERAAEAKHDAEAWPAVAKPVLEGLRARRSAALVAYLLARESTPRFRTKNDLFDHFLIDVEMDACMSTSRLVCAIGSVQLFVQRALLNLEPVTLTTTQAKHWNEWMKRYRVWEANRKVFLYPENWIEPELRDDKTPFFRELETELLQSDLTPEAAEDAFRHYLEKLHDVGRLQIAGMHREARIDDESRPNVVTDVFHVIGRTWNVPRVYYYRRREERAGTVVWTPWEKVPVDIEGDHLVPVVWNRRLHLFWPLFTEKQDPATPEQRAKDIDPPKYVEVRLAWSELRNGAWSTKRVSSISENLTFKPDWTGDKSDFFLKRSRYTFKAVLDGQSLVIQCLHPGYTIQDPQPPPLGPPEMRFTGTLVMDEPLTSRNGLVTLTLKLFRQNPPAPDDGLLVLEAGGAILWQPKVRRTVQLAVMNETFALHLTPPEVGQQLDTLLQSSPWSTNHPVPGAFLRVEDDGALNIYHPDGVTVLWSSFADGGYAFVPPQPEAESGEEPSLPDFRGTFMGQFSFDGCGGAVHVSQRAFREGTLLEPDRSDLDHISLCENTDPGDSLILLKEDESPVEVLRKTPGIFRVPFSPQDPEFLSQGRFFFEDEEKTFLVHLADQPAVNLDRPTAAYPGKTEEMKLASPYVGQIAAEPLADTGSPPQFTMAELVSVRAWPERDGGTLANQMADADNPRVLDFIDRRRYAFEVFYHPYVCEAIGRLERGGVDALLAWPMTPSPTGQPPRPRRFGQEGGDFSFKRRYDPDASAAVVRTPHPQELLDFASEGSTPYSQYNWELFFHVPLLIATQLGKRQRFAAAQKWFHYIFDPTDRSVYTAEPARFWKFRRFFDDAASGTPQTLQELMQHSGELAGQVSAWRSSPFSPHVLARMRLAAYQKNVVMKYVDNLIAWGDQLFRQESLEALNEASQIYVLAAEILGERPVTIPPPATTADTYTYAELTQLDPFSDQLVEVENLLPDGVGDGDSSETGWQVVLSVAEYAPVFCIPGNDQLLGYWDTVADRLFKLRHCMDIEGVVRERPLFEPPIDPALLVRAAAAGVDLDTVLNDTNTALPHYRFATMTQKASELCADVKALGSALLAALDKKDAEELAQLRAGHEVDLLRAIRDVKQKQVDEAKETLAGLNRYQEVVAARQAHYASRPYVNVFETGHLAGVSGALPLMAGQIGLETIAGVIHMIPDLKVGAVTTIGATTGGSSIAGGLQAIAGAMGASAGMVNTAASISATLGGFDRRMDDWKHQADLAARELRQIERQIAGAEIRAAITENELANHDRQIEQSRAVDELLRAKFTNRDLHLWMAGQISALYFQAYQLAYDVARKAERAYQFERADPGARFIQFGSWDGLKKGLLAGERLHQDLKRMEAAYLDQNRREYEITKHVSLVDLDARALLSLKETGTCFVNLPETLFDADFPGHFLRRMKSVSLTIPCVTGPYDGVNCTLTLLRNSVRMDSKGGSSSSYPRDDKQKPDPRFRDNVGTVQSIVTSHGQNDGGLFELNFRDERYLPFEGAGAISEWRIELSPEHNRFDFKSLSDVVLHVKYTAREGGQALRDAAGLARSALVGDKGKTPLVHVFSARREFGDDWHRFLHPPTSQPGQVLDLDLTGALPYQPGGRAIKITQVDFFLETAVTGSIAGELYQVIPNQPDALLASLTLAAHPQLNDLHHAAAPLAQGKPPGPWRLRIPTTLLPPETTEDLWIACRFTRDA